MTRNRLLILSSVVNMAGGLNADGIAKEIDCTNPVAEWVAGFTGQIQVFDATRDAEGNLLIVGSFTATADFDPGPGIDEHVAPPGPTGNAFVSKLYRDGSYAWTRSFGGDMQDDARGVVVDAAENVIVAGWFTGTADFDPGEGVNERTAVGSQNINAFVTRFNPAGDYLSTWVFGQGTCEAEVERIALDSQDNLLLTGIFCGTVDFDPGPAVYNRTGVSDVFVSKLTNAGAHVWTQTFGGSGADIGTGIAVDPSDAVITVGEFRGSVDFDPSSGTDVHTTITPFDIFIMKFNSDGSYGWTRTLPVGFPSIRGAVACDTAGDVFTTGYFGIRLATVDFDPTDGEDFHTTTPGDPHTGDAFVTKLLSDGAYGWTKTFGALSGQTGQSLVTDPNQNVVVLGEYVGQVDFDPGPDEHWLTSAGIDDAFLVSFDPDGAFRWGRSLGGESNDVPQAMAIAPDGTIAAIGYFQFGGDYDPGCALGTIATDGGISTSLITCVDASADADVNGNIDLFDFAAFQNCFTGPTPNTCASGCYNFDFDGDDDFDLSDFASFAEALISP